MCFIEIVFNVVFTGKKGKLEDLDFYKHECKQLTEKNSQTVEENMPGRNPSVKNFWKKRRTEWINCLLFKQRLTLMILFHLKFIIA